MNRPHVFRTLSRDVSNCILLDHVLLSCPVFPLFYQILYYIYPYILLSTFPTLLHQTWNLRLARLVITIHRRMKKHILREQLHVHCRRQPILIANQMFEHPTQLSSIELEIASVWVIILMKQDEDDTDREITNDECEDSVESTLWSDFEEEDLDIGQKVLHQDQARRDKTIRTTRVLLRKTQSHADTVIARTPLPNLLHPVRAIAPPLRKGHKSAINISCESDVVQVLLLPKASGDHNVPQPKISGNHNIPQYQKATFEVVKRFMEAIVFTKTPWRIISDGNYSMVDEAWKLAIEAQHRQWALAGAAVGTPSVWQLPSGLSFKINPQTREAVSVYSVFCSLIGLMMKLNPQKYIDQTRD